MDKRFLLTPAKPYPIAVLEGVSLVRLALGEHTPLKHIKKRVKVAEGALLATHPSPNVGDLHAPFDGIIKDVAPSHIELEYAPLPVGEEVSEPAGEEAGKPAEPPVERVSPVSFAGLDAIELGKILKTLGISIRPFIRPCDLLIINCINPEPGMLYTQELLASYLPVLEAGVSLLRRLNNAPRFILALPEGSPFALQGAAPHYVKAVYPVSLSRILIQKVTGKEDVRRVATVRLHSLFQLGLAAQSGLPLTRSVTTAFGSNFFLPLGTPISSLLDKTGRSLESGDTVILGGAMRGAAIADIRRGIGKEDDAVGFVKKGGMPDLEDNPCINCGACVSVCPVRIRPNMLSRYSEFGLYEHCPKEFIEICIECGMCGYVCPACRPMQQYFRMAKHKLGLQTLQHVLRS